ncbi:hypothetical protein AB0N77_21005 [Streptomyces misionensis]|uniref:hypothetical protein n=1 Tax=Streptomyces misionensis TaxID=67331 RepID=UPI00343C79DB
MAVKWQPNGVPTPSGAVQAWMREPPPRGHRRLSIPWSVNAVGPYADAISSSLRQAVSDAYDQKESCALIERAAYAMDRRATE